MVSSGCHISEPQFLGYFLENQNPPRSGKTRALKTSGSGSLSAAQVNYQRFCQSSSLFVDQRSCLPPIYKLVTLFLSKFHKLSTELRHLLVGNWLVLRRNRTAILNFSAANMCRKNNGGHHEMNNLGQRIFT